MGVFSHHLISNDKKPQLSDPPSPPTKHKMKKLTNSHGEARLGLARRGKAWLGMARQGLARQGKARHFHSRGKIEK